MVCDIISKTTNGAMADVIRYVAKPIFNFFDTKRIIIIVFISTDSSQLCLAAVFKNARKLRNLNRYHQISFRI